MIGSFIGMGLKAVSGVAGAIAARKAGDRTQKGIEEMQAKNRAWYDGEMAKDPTRRASALAMINKTQEALRERSRQAAGNAAVMGASEESAAAAKAANNEVLAQTMSGIAVADEARKDAVGQEFRAKDDMYAGKMLEAQTQKDQEVQKAIGAFGAVGESLIGM